MKKTILHLTCMESTKYGGLEHYIAEIARQCNEHGYKTIVQYEDYPKSSKYRIGLKRLGVDVAVFRSQLSLLQDIKQITKLICTVRPVIIQTYFPGRSVRFITPIIAKMLGVQKTIAMIQSMEHLSRRSIIARVSYNRYDHVICISQAIADNVVNAGIHADSVSTLYMGVFAHVKQSAQLRHHLRNEFNIPHQNRVFACIAFDNPFKGLDILLRAFSAVSGKRADVDLIIVGVDRDQSQLPTLAKELGISRRVHWAGIRDEGWQVLNAADIYVQSSRFGEGLSFATIESMALKLPVVATRVAGPGEIVLDDETGYLCEPDSVDSLSKAMQKILNEPEKCEEMGRAGYRRYLNLLRGEKSVKTLIQNYYFS